MMYQIAVDGIDVSKFNDAYFAKAKAKKAKNADGEKTVNRTP